MVSRTTVDPSASAVGRGVARIDGIDLARCLAILGMLVAHVGYVASGDDDTGWVMPFDGRSAALFATLAGVSLSIITRRADASPRGWTYARYVIAVRGALLLVIGYVLVLAGTPIEIILPAYGVMFLLVLPLVRLPVGALAAIAVGVVAVAPVVVLGLQQWWVGEVYPDTDLATYDPVLTGTYPALTWIGYLLVGLVVGRTALTQTALRRTSGAWMLVVVGLVLAPLGYGAGHLLARASGASTGQWPGVLLSVEPHADTGFELVGNIGVALVVLGLCLVATRVGLVRRLVAPLLAAGSMSLTIYTLQIVIIALLGEEVVNDPTSNGPLLALAVGSVAAAWAWRAAVGRGPLEQVVAKTARVVASASVRDGRGRASPSGSRDDDRVPTRGVVDE